MVSITKTIASAPTIKTPVQAPLFFQPIPGVSAFGIIIVRELFDQYHVPIMIVLPITIDVREIVCRKVGRAYSWLYNYTTSPDSLGWYGEHLVAQPILVAYVVHDRGAALVLVD